LASVLPAGLSAKDIDRLVKFEVLGYTGGRPNRAGEENPHKPVARQLGHAREADRESEAAYQRPVIRRKIDELVAYYRECKDAATLPAIPGARHHHREKRFTFHAGLRPARPGPAPDSEEHGVLRVLSRPASAPRPPRASPSAGESMHIEVPAVLFDSRDARQIVELFVTINSKHTRLNPSHIIRPGGRKLYPDANQALAHRRDHARSRGRHASPLHGEISMSAPGASG